MRVAQTGWIASRLAAMALGVLLALPAHAQTPSVVASVPPVHALVAGVMEGVGTPDLLVRGGRSPHSAALRPSDIRRLQSADVIVWVGPGLESFMTRPLASLKPKPRLLTLFEAPGIKRLSPRKGGAWEDHDRHAHEDEVGVDVSHRFIDPHIWLSPANAVAITDAVASSLRERDPANAAAYAANARRVKQRVKALVAEISATLTPVRRMPYLVFHDAYQYFERDFGLSPVGAITISPERQISAHRLAEIRDHMAKTGARCAFREPQFPPRLIDTIVAGTDVRIGVLDPLGADIPPGPDHWFTVMKGLAASLARCLGQAG
jgi:zinc transport system substrate-binding protein